MRTHEDLRPGKAIVRQLLEVGFGKRDRSVFERLVREDYVQHNPLLPTGRAGLVLLLDELAKLPHNHFRPLRMLEDGDLVAVHSEWIPAGQPRAVVDLFRIRDGLLAEHWDAIQDMPGTSVDGRGMTDGTTEIADRELTSANRALVCTFVQRALIDRRAGPVEALVSDTLVQHNRHLGNGRSGLVEHLQASNATGALRHQRLRRVVAEGNFVLTQSEGAREEAPTAIYDLFRCARSQIVEHWAVAQPVPAQALHQNGMF